MLLLGNYHSLQHMCWRSLLLLVLLVLGVALTHAFPTVFSEPGQGLDESEKQIEALKDRVAQLEEAMAGAIMVMRGNLLQWGIDEWTNSFWDKHPHLDVVNRYNKALEEAKRIREEERAVRNEKMRKQRYEDMRHACICSQFLGQQLDVDCGADDGSWLSDTGRKECCDPEDGNVICNLDEGTPGDYYRHGMIRFIAPKNLYA